MYAVLGNQPKMCEVRHGDHETAGTREYAMCMYTLQVLLQAEADVNIRDSSGYTPLLWAAFQAKSEVMKVLLKYLLLLSARISICLL